MSKLTQYRVVREHHGDKPYVAGDIRVAAERDVAHLIPHVLEPIGPVTDDEPAAKAEDAPLNKAETAAPANKAARSRKSKTA